MNSVARANPSTQQTNTNLVPSRSGRFVNVEHIYLSSDTEMTVTILNADTHSVLWRQYVGARGGSAIPVRFKSAPGEGLDYTTSAIGNIYLQVEYRTI